MNVTVKYFGRIAEITKVTSEIVALDEGVLLSDVREMLFDKYEGLKNEAFKLALNQDFCEADVNLKSNSEIAFLPPFAGG